MIEYVKILGPVFNAMKEKLEYFREVRKTIQLATNMSPEEKLERYNTVLAGENMMLQTYLNGISDMDLEYVLRDTMSFIYLDTYEKPKEKDTGPSFGLQTIE